MGLVSVVAKSLGVVWNFCEVFEIKAFAKVAPYAFGIICGCKGKRVNDEVTNE